MRIFPETTGHEEKNKRKPARRPEVKNMYCPRDGHYCEQGDCDSCMAETVGGDKWHEPS